MNTKLKPHLVAYYDIRRGNGVNKRLLVQLILAMWRRKSSTLRTKNNVSIF